MSMAESAVRFLIENVSRVVEDGGVVSGWEKELRWVMMDLERWLLLMGTDCLAMGEESQIKRMVYELEDAIDACFTQARNSNWFSRFRQRHNNRMKIKELRLRLRSLSLSLSLNHPIAFLLFKEGIIHKGKGKGKGGDLHLHLRTPPPITDSSASHQYHPETFKFQPSKSERVVVGFEDEEETIIRYLTEESPQKDKEELGVISIIGMRGLGKTVLARKIFDNKRIVDEFPYRIWIHVSQCSTYRDVSCNIIRSFTDEDLSNETDGCLHRAVGSILQDTKFLLVLDSVRSVDDWKAIYKTFPHSNGRGKVLITSCENFVQKPSHNLSLHLRSLTRAESWKLLRSQALQDCPPKLEQVGQAIAAKCGGLPLQILLVGGLLASLAPIKSEWHKVLEIKNLFLHNQRSIWDAVQLIYTTLPHDLRDSFLYLGVFPQGYEISVWTLTCLWIAEGFVQPKDGQTLEDTAVRNLYRLIKRNLVMVGKANPIGEVKTCRVHDMVRAFCMYKAREQNLFQEIKSSHDVDGVSKLQACRRLCIHSDNVNTLLSQATKNPCLRSFLCLCEEVVDLKPKFETSIFDAFILLRVLDSKLIKFNTFPTRITGLFHLRYVTLYVEQLDVLPKSLSKLWNLQTLVVDTASQLIKTEAANIWGLRHVKTNAAIVVSSSRGKGENLLQTLNTLSPESCTGYVSRRAHNLKALKIRGELRTLFGKRFMENLVGLEKLKLVNDLYRDIGGYDTKLLNQLGLPQPKCFPPNLRRLTLSNTFFTWKHMSTLAKINTLEVLKLKNDAFSGEHWVVGDDCCFPSLQYLVLARAELTVWEASTDSFPKLSCLVLKCCRWLKAFPDLKSLDNLQLKRVHSSILEKAKRIADQKAKSGIPFKLSIVPGV